MPLNFAGSISPDHYAAIHFHDDDIYDFEWDCDFEFEIPQDMPSGVYVMRIHAEGHEDAIPFFVCPPVNKPRSDVSACFNFHLYGIRQPCAA